MNKETVQDSGIDRRCRDKEKNLITVRQDSEKKLSVEGKMGLL